MSLEGKDAEFVSAFNECYPFERYILKNPVSLDFYFNDCKLTEIFIPTLEYHKDLSYICNDIYVKFQCNGVEIKFAYLDFNESYRENIRDAVYEDFGDYEWECLGVDHNEDNSIENELLEVLKIQQKLITSKYNECSIKKYYLIDKVKNALENSVENKE